LVSIKRIFSDLNVFRREYLRNRAGLFFSLIFPIILIAIFGAIFSGGSNGPITVYTQNFDTGSVIPCPIVIPNVTSTGPKTWGTCFLEEMNATNVVRMKLISNNQSLTAYLQSHSGAVGMEIPANFSSSFIQKKSVNVTVYSNPSDNTGQIVLGVASGVINSFNLARANATAILGLSSQSVVSKNYTYIDFLIPGLIGFTILTSPMFSMVNISSEYKKSKFFKQLSLTPLTKGEWLTSKVIWYIVLSIISFILMTTFGRLVFDAQVNINAAIIPFLLIGPLFFVSLGMLVGTVTKSVESAAVIGNVITFPMMFLSGTFFPISLMPSYLQAFAHVLPLFYLIEGLNNVMVYSNYPQALFDVLVLVVISAIVFVLAVRFFKWRED